MNEKIVVPALGESVTEATIAKWLKSVGDTVEVDEPIVELEKSKNINKVIMWSGKIYFDLLEAREKFKRRDVVLLRIEQLYPFPAKSLVKSIKPYAKNAEFIWCQEEPKIWGHGRM